MMELSAIHAEASSRGIILGVPRKKRGANGRPFDAAGGPAFLRASRHP